MSDMRYMYAEIDRILSNVSDRDAYIFIYLLEHAIWQFYQGTYDEDYRLPWTILEHK